MRQHVEFTSKIYGPVNLQAAARLALEQHLDAGQALPRKPHVTFEEPAPTDSGASDGGHIRGAPFAEHQLANGAPRFLWQFPASCRPSRKPFISSFPNGEAA